ncbi:hypothetical protein OG280_37265 [Streptomyces virginiae]|uniref:hypothetical protein n=1 Tax=Streptomyces virginiae TaxID=1961 RepID=UPI00324C26EE
MTRGRKIAVVVVAVACIVSTPLFWLLNGPNTGQLVGASVQAAAGVAALVWALFQHPTPAGPVDRATNTGEASGGGVTGIKRPGGRGDGSATAEGTGDAKGQGSVSGIDYSN